jgi:hypothetical protein
LRAGRHPASATDWRPHLRSRPMRRPCELLEFCDDCLCNSGRCRRPARFRVGKDEAGEVGIARRTDRGSGQSRHEAKAEPECPCEWPPSFPRRTLG